jgi:hypothetical protein
MFTKIADEKASGSKYLEMTQLGCHGGSHGLLRADVIPVGNSESQMRTGNLDTSVSTSKGTMLCA